MPHPGVDNSRHITASDKKYYAYYQWVCFVLFIQGVMFYVPYYLWKIWEGGHMRAITMGMQIAILADEERGYKKKLIIEYLHRHLKMHRIYAIKYFFCEILCLANVIGQMYLTDKFFDGQFLSFGFDVLQFASEQQNVDPMISVFPKMTKCTFHFYGSSGDVQKQDALCLLPLNVVNEKIYLFLWFWFIILSLLSIFVVISRLFILSFKGLRAKCLQARCRFSKMHHLKTICRCSDFGDFFVLYLLSKNIDPVIMQDIIIEIAKRLDQPDQSQLNGEARHLLQDARDRINRL